MRRSYQQRDSMKYILKICLIFILLTAASCGQTTSQTPDSDNDSTEATQGSDNNLEVTESSSVLFGFWGLNGYISKSGLDFMQSNFGLSVIQVASSDPVWTVGTLLPLVQEAGLKITLRLAGSHSNYTTSSGDFDLASWKSQIELWEDSGVQDYIDNGTLIGHMILDDIYNFSGQDATAADLDEMARYSQQILPGLMTFVRERASSMPIPASGTYLYVDAVVNQYRSFDGDVTTYLETQIAAADSLGVDIINGLNLCDGGDGSSGQMGWRADKFAMTPTEIYEAGQVLLNAPDLEIFLMWEFDANELWADGTTIGADVFSQSEYKSVFQALSEIAAPSN